MPSRLKDESQDIKGNKYVISAADFNKHDEEIRAIERSLGLKRPGVPGKGFSGAVTSNGFSSYSCPTTTCFPGIESCSVSADVFAALSTIAQRLVDIRDEMMRVASGTLAVIDPFAVGVTGIIPFPSDWNVKTLVDDIPDAVQDEEDDLQDIASIRLNSVSGLPDRGFISIINDASMMIAQDSGKIFVPGLTSLAVSGTNIYANLGVIIAGGPMTPNRFQRVIALGTNVEVMEYNGIDVANNAILNVSRRRLGSTPTRHAASDLVFPGILSLHASPSLVKIATPGGLISQIDCVVRSNGKINVAAYTSEESTTTTTTGTESIKFAIGPSVAFIFPVFGSSDTTGPASQAASLVGTENAFPLGFVTAGPWTPTGIVYAESSSDRLVFDTSLVPSAANAKVGDRIYVAFALAPPASQAGVIVEAQFLTITSVDLSVTNRVTIMSDQSFPLYSAAGSLVLILLGTPVNQTTVASYTDDTLVAYANYHAVLMRHFDPLPEFSPGNAGRCED